MTKNEAAVSETDAVIFPMEFGQDKREKVTVGEPNAKLVVERQPSKSGVEIRFARLKRSLRKRSASIL